jgi:hypothetical protein
MDIDGLDTVVRASGFTGVIVVRRAGTVVFNEAYGYATPRWLVPNTVDTRFDTASITSRMSTSPPATATSPTCPSQESWPRCCEIGWSDHCHKPAIEAIPDVGPHLHSDDDGEGCR